MRLLFDLDGTLTNPYVGITSCIQHALTRLEKEVPPAEDLAWCIGPPLRDIFLSLLNTTDEQLASKAVELYRERFGTIGLFENEVYPGIAACLRDLSQGGYSMSVATAKPTVFARRIIEHFEMTELFCAVDGCEMDGTHSDKTSLIAHILERDQLSPGEVIMIGDRMHDMIGAADNQVQGIGVLWGYGSVEELREAGACLHVDTPGDLVDAISRAGQSGSGETSDPSPQKPPPSAS